MFPINYNTALGKVEMGRELLLHKFQLNPIFFHQHQSLDLSAEHRVLESLSTGTLNALLLLWSFTPILLIHE